MELTLKLDLLNVAEAEQTLEKAAALVAMVKAGMAGADATVTNSTSSEIPAPVLTNGLNEASAARKVFDDILTSIDTQGYATLGEIAKNWKVETKTIRGHLLNGMRSLKHRNQEPPFTSAWHPDKGCVVYTAKV